MTSDHPTWPANLHVACTRALIDGALVPARITVEHGRITALDHGAEAASGGDVLTDAILVPAPLDLHFHGAGGEAVPPRGTCEAIDVALARLLTAHDAVHPALPATYQYLATLPAPDPRTGGDVVAACASLAPSAGCVGARIEGCFLNPEKRGVWPRDMFHMPDTGLLDDMIAACAEAGVSLRILDVAPELPGAIELIEHAVARDIIVSLAHTNATWDEARRGIDAGATLATHTFNAMRALHHREPGVVGAVLTDERVTTELICDGVHVHEGMIALAYAAKHDGGIVAVSDASPLAGQPPGTYEWAGMHFTHDGTSLRAGDGSLAGSATILVDAPRTLASAGVPHVDQLIATYVTPYRVLHGARENGLRLGDVPIALRA